MYIKIENLKREVYKVCIKYNIPTTITFKE